MFDSASTRHIVDIRSYLSSFVWCTGMIKAGNNKVVGLIGCGTVMVTTVDNGLTYHIALQDVIYTSDIMFNFISTSRARKWISRIIIDDDDMSWEKESWNPFTSHQFHS